MKLHFKEDPREWRKVALIGQIGPSVIVCILRLRGVISSSFLISALIVFAVVALSALAQPRWFRGYYRFSTRLGFYTFQFLGRIILTAFFFIVLTPFGWILRLLGKDVLQLAMPRDKQTFWRAARKDSSLESMF